MTNKECWLKLFSENDTALASAIILCRRFASEEQLGSSKDFIDKTKTWLYEKADNELKNLVCVDGNPVV